MRRREQIWNDYKNHPFFKMYDVYHWEAHPNSQYPEPTTLAQRVSHYEAYIEKYPIVVWPGLVQEPINNPISELFGLFQDYWGDQTYLILVDAKGKIAYQNSFPRGTNNISKIYDDIENLIPDLLDETVISYNVKIKSKQTISIKYYNTHISIFTNPRSSAIFNIFTSSGKKVLSKDSNDGILNIQKSDFSPGNYILNVELMKTTLTKSFVIH